MEDREGDVGAEQAPAARSSTSSPPRVQRPSRPISTSITSWPASRSPAATEAPERSEISCSEERPPRITATLTVASGAAVELSSGVGWGRVVVDGRVVVVSGS